IPIGLNATGITVSPDGSRIYTANTNSNTVSVISRVSNTFAFLTNIPGLNAPFTAVVSTDGNILYVTNSGSTSVTVINTTNYNKTSITTSGNPYGISINAD